MKKIKTNKIPNNILRILSDALEDRRINCLVFSGSNNKYENRESIKIYKDYDKAHQWLYQRKRKDYKYKIK